jgi:hypothetical protein
MVRIFLDENLGKFLLWRINTIKNLKFLYPFLAKSKLVFDYSAKANTLSLIGQKHYAFVKIIYFIH